MGEREQAYSANAPHYESSRTEGSVGPTAKGTQSGSLGWVLKPQRLGRGGGTSGHPGNTDVWTLQLGLFCNFFKAFKRENHGVGWGPGKDEEEQMDSRLR